LNAVGAAVHVIEGCDDVGELPVVVGISASGRSSSSPFGAERVERAAKENGAGMSRPPTVRGLLGPNGARRMEILVCRRRSAVVA
jgi:hypothetical protein